MIAPPNMSRTITSISPARIERLLSCPLRVAFEQDAQDAATGSSRGAGHGATSLPAAVGTAVHRAIELAIDQRLDADAAWDLACDEVAERGTDPREANNATRMRLRLGRRLPQLIQFIDDKHPLEILTEHWMRSIDGRLQGRADLVLLGEEAVVVDVKSGLSENDDGSPRDAYVRQLAVYAHLVAESHEVGDVTCAIFSLRDGMVPVHLRTDDRDAMVAEAIHSLDAFNMRVPHDQPAQPSCSACSWCPYLTECDAAWRAVTDGTIDSLNSGLAVRGAITDDPQVARNDRAALRVSSRQGSAQGDLLVTDVPAALVVGAKAGDDVAVTGLRMGSDNPVVLTWRDQISMLVVT